MTCLLQLGAKFILDYSSFFFFFHSSILDVVCLFISFFPSYFFLHPCLSFQSLPSSHHELLSTHRSSVALLTPLSPNPLKEKAWMGIQSLHHKDWTRSANKAAKSFSSLFPLLACLCPICLSLSPLAFISGDKGLFVRAASREKLPSWMEECGTSSLFL